MEDFRVAVAQTCSPVGRTAENLSKMRQFVQQARKKKADIVCFPELNISGYWLHRNLHDLAEPIPGKSTEAVVEMARENSVTILAGLAEVGKNGVVYDTHIVATPMGYAGKYRKLHINEEEIPYFSYGHDTPVFQHPKAIFGIQICYDSHFPELSTVFALKGCKVLFFPHASAKRFGDGETESREEKKARWLRYLPARAYDNALFVVVGNQVGENGKGNTFAGTSMILDPQGELIAEAQTDAEELLIADLKVRDLLRVRRDQRWHFFLHYRRPELYRTLVDKTP